MIEAGAYTRNIWQEQSERTAGHMPGVAQKVSSAARAEADSFDALVKSASGNAPSKASASSAARSEKMPKEDGGGFFEFFKTVLDIINPLQHIPVINTLYRHLTGDEISPVARLAGDTLFGGPVGAALALADIAVESSTGKDMGSTAMAFLSDKKGSKDKTAEPTMLASAETYNAIQPSSGGGQIIWDDAVPASDQNKFSSSPNVAPTGQRTGMNEKGPAAPPPSHAQPVPPQKNGTSLLSHGETMQRVEAGTEHALQAKDAPAVLPLQDAPVAFADRKSVPSELLASGEDKSQIANKMMDALDKYTAMKKAEFSQSRTF